MITKVVNEIIRLDDAKVLIKRYKIRSTGRESRSIETTIPREVFKREARCLGLTVDEAMIHLEAVWRYNSFQGLHLAFEGARNE